MKNMSNHKIIISGTGRAGTTFIMKIFSYLGLDTGFSPKDFEQFVDKQCNAGLELFVHLLNGLHVPYIIKSPLFLEHVEETLSKIVIDYVIIPIRDFNKSAESRFKNNNNPTRAGVLWNATDVESQKNFYYKIIAEYVLLMEKHDIPTIFIDFDKMIVNPEYMYKKLKPVLDIHNKPFIDFHRAYIVASNSSAPH